MRSLRLLSLSLLALLAGACASSRSRESAIPWARPGAWESSPF